MKKIVSLLAVSSALMLTACGGSSDSSVDEQLNKYSQCQVLNKTVLIPTKGGCQMSYGNLNFGDKFALECRFEKVDLETKENLYRIVVLGENNPGIQSVIRDIESSLSNYKFDTSLLNYKCIE